MKRILNYRIAMFFAFALCGGVAVGGCVFRSLLMSILIPVASVAVGILLYFLCKKHTAWILLLAFSVGISLFVIDNAIMEGNDFEGQVLMRVETAQGEGRAILSSDAIKGKVYLQGEEDLEEGDEVLVSGAFKKVEFSFTDSTSRYFYSQRITYRVKDAEVAKVGHKESVFQKLRKKGRDVMLRYMDREDMSLCMSLVFGDRSYLAEDTKNDMAGAGISHVLAVSGLHVGFLTAILVFLLKKLRVKRGLRLILTALFLILFGLLTGFPPGAKRAIIMYAAVSLAPLLRRKRDDLSTLSAAVILIVLTEPRELFDTGFLMSVGAVCGIVLFYRPLYRILSRKIKFAPLRTLYGILCVTLAANVFVLPLGFSEFGKFSLYAAVGNLIALPIVSIAFPAIFVTAFLSLVFQGFGVLYYAFRYPIIAIRVISSALASLPGADISVAGLGVATVGYVLFFATLSHFVLIKRKNKIITCCAFGVTTVFLLLFL